MGRRQPEGPPPAPIVQRIRIRYAKRGRLRFSSHRDFARAFERALRRAEIPMAYSAGFHPHPKISYVGAAPTGVASEAEYLEIALSATRDPEQVRAAIDSALPDGLDLLEARDAADCPPGSLAERIEGSRWQLEFSGADGVDIAVALDTAVAALLASTSVPVERVTKEGRRTLEAREPIVSAVSKAVSAAASSGASDGDRSTRAILDLVVRQVTPAVRPDDVLTALRSVAGFAPPQPPRATRLAQGPVDDAGSVGDPLSTTVVQRSTHDDTSVGTR